MTFKHAETNSSLLARWDAEAAQLTEGVRAGRRQDEVEAHLARVREHFSPAWARYIEAIHACRPTAVTERLYDEARADDRRKDTGR